MCKTNPLLNNLIHERLHVIDCKLYVEVDYFKEKTLTSLIGF